MFDNLTRKVSGALRLVPGKSTITEKNIDDAVETIETAPQAMTGRMPGAFR
jgi:signal recognition particle subunit SRP54